MKQKNNIYLCICETFYCETTVLQMRTDTTLHTLQILFNAHIDDEKREKKEKPNQTKKKQQFWLNWVNLVMRYRCTSRIHFFMVRAHRK